MAQLNQTNDESKKPENLFRFAMKGEWPKVIRMYEEDKMAHCLKITKSKETALHVAVSDGREDTVEKLVKHINLMDTKALEMKNEDGNTPLHLAAAIGNEKMCGVIVGKNDSLIEIKNNEGETPFFLAASCGHKKAFLKLHHLRKDKSYTNCRRKDGESILHCAIDGECLDLAYQIINLYGDLVTCRNKGGLTPLHYLAMKPTVFRSGCHIRRLNNIIYHCTFVGELKVESQEPEKAVISKVESNCPDTYKSCNQFYQLLRDAIYGVIDNIKSPKSNSPDVEAPKAGTPSDGQRAPEQSRLVPDNYVTCFDFATLVSKAMLIILGLGSRDINKMKQKKEKHTWSIQIMKELVKLTPEYGSTGENPNEEEATDEHESNNKASPYFLPHEESSSNSDGEQRATQSRGAKKTETPLLLAAKNGAAEMVREILKNFPVAINDTNEEKKNAVLLAVENRQPQVYKALLDWGFLKDVVFRKVDKDGNSALHLAANLVGTNTPWTIPGDAVQMQWEIKWYEYIRDSKPVHYFPRHNKNGESPREIFTKTHRHLLKSGGEWLTKTSESCSVVAALIAAVAFATAATVPGGNDQNKGTPLLGNRPVFDVFAIGSLFALGFSITSLVMFLAILTSRYQEKDFRTSLPSKLLLGLTSLFMSIGAMLVSFCAGHFFVLKDNLKYAAFPIYALTCLPVSFFAVAQFPLYFDLMRAIFMEVPLRNYTVVPDSTQKKPADDKKFEDIGKEITQALKNLIK